MSASSDWRNWPVLKQGIEISAALAGPRPARRRRRRDLATARDFGSQLPFIASCGEFAADSGEAPIFILSAGWRSGSTMLQRMLMGDRSVLVWGEPYDHSDVLGTLKRQLLAFTDDWPARNFFFDGEVEGMADRWVANLYPALRDLHAAHVAYFVRLFADPARGHGCERWGVKEVRWTVDDARYLRWLFPRARFLFLCRNPLDAWRSYRTSRCWYLRWPDEPIFTPYAFGRFWAALAADYRDHADQVGGMFLRYEDLLEAEDVATLRNYLATEVIHPRDLARIRSAKKVTGPTGVPALERWLLRRGCGDVAASLGYEF